MVLALGLPAAPLASAQSPAPGAQPPAPSSGSPAAQAQPSPTSGIYVVKKQVEEVQLHATVLDKNHRLVTNLDKSAFTVFEDGKPQQITSFRREDIPVSIGILVDNSGSMREKRAAVNNAALNLVRSSNPEDEVFVVNFSEEAYIDQSFTSDIKLLREALEKIESRGGTAMFDAIVGAADELKRNGKREKKVLLVITDGEDNASKQTLEQAIRHVQDQNGPTVYTIGIFGQDEGRGEKKRAERALKAISSRTGGAAFLPKSLAEVDSVSQEVARDIRSQYSLGYKTPVTRPGYRTVKVTAKARGYSNLEVRTRSGYFAGEGASPK